MSQRSIGGRLPEAMANELAAQLVRYLAHAVDERGVGARTLANYRRDLARFVEFLGARGATSCAAVTRLLLREWLSSLRSAGVPAASAARVAREVRHFLCFGAGEGAPDPFSGLQLPKAPRLAPAALRVDQVASVLAAPSADALGLRDRAVLAVLYATGLRVSQLVGLDLKHVDSAAAELRLWDKYGRPRPAFLGTVAMAAVGRYVEEARCRFAGEATSQALFLSRLGRRLSAREVHRLVVRHAKTVGLAMSPRDLRVACAMHLRAGGARAGVVKQLLGTTLATTRAPRPIETVAVS